MTTLTPAPFAQRLRHARINAGLPRVADAAGIYNVSARTWYAWESGSCTPHQLTQDNLLGVLADLAPNAPKQPRFSQK